MRYLVTALARNPLTQEVSAENGDAAIETALANPNGWRRSPPDDRVEWEYYSTPLDPDA